MLFILDIFNTFTVSKMHMTYQQSF